VNSARTSCQHAQLAKVCESLATGATFAKAYVQSVDRYIAQLRDLGLLNATLIAGPVVIRRSHGSDGPSDSGELIQAAISLEQGTVAIFWDSEDFALYQHDAGFEAEAMLRARPLRECASGIQTILWPAVNDCLAVLLEKVAFATDIESPVL
jgi:hypothetical protein